ncbi:MAG: glycosyltransferase family 2 protein [Chloroflexi bacterium]|nr:MAG: glycosyltransferase family 2 protein [Chloroflexota bacterium]
MKTSIIITSYNYGLYIERCIRSCFEQKYIEPRSLEVIIVDDHSQDNTLEVIGKFKSFPNFRVIENHQNVGVAEAANIGIRNSMGRYFVRVDADDYISGKMIFFMESYLEYNKDAFGVACDYLMVNENETVTERRSAERAPISCGIMYRRDLFVQAGLYNPDFRHREEEELRLRLGDYYTLHYLRMPLYRYRMHKLNKTKHPDYELFHHKLNAIYNENSTSAR